MKKILFLFFLFISLFANAVVIDSAKVAQLITNGSKAFCHILDINAEALYQHKQSDMQFVIEVPVNYVKVEAHGANAALGTLEQAIKDSANAKLRRIYLEYGVEMYVVMINSLDVVIKDTIKGAFTTQNFFHAKLYDSLTNVTELKNLHNSITNRIIAQSLSGQDRDCMILSQASYCGAFFPGKNKFCIGLEVLSAHHSTSVTYPELSRLKEYLFTRMQQQYLTTATNDNFSLPATVDEFADAVKFIRLRQSIRQTFTTSGLDDIFDQFEGQVDYESLSTDDRVHALSVYSGYPMSGDWFGMSGEETQAIKIIQHTPSDKVHDLLYYLEQPNPLKGNVLYGGDQSNDALIKKLIDRTHDAVMSADNNYTKLVMVITQLIMSSEQTFEEKKPAETDNWLDRIFYWDDTYLFGSDPPIGTHAYDVEWTNGNAISVQKKIVDGRIPEYVALEDHYIYYPHWDGTYTPVVLQPFDLIFFTNRSNNGMLQSAGATKGDIFVAPAIFLKYADDKTFNANALKVTVISLDLLAIALGPGAIWAAVEAGSYGLAAFEALQFLGSGASLLLNAITDPDLQSLIEKYNMIVGIWGISRIINSGVKYTVNYFTEAATGGFQKVPVATAREFENAFHQAGTKVDQLSAEMKGKVKSMEDYLEGKVGVVNSILNDVSFTDFANTVEEFKNGANAGLAQQSYNLWKEQRWGELEQLFTAHNFNGGWPPYGGAISAQNTSLQVGKEFDRFGGWIDNSGFHDNGFFASPRDVPFEQRALPQSSLSKPHKKYRVLISFEVEEGQAIPWFNQPGMGTQYKFSETIDKLKQNGFIEEIQ